MTYLCAPGDPASQSATSVWSALGIPAARRLALRCVIDPHLGRGAHCRRSAHQRLPGAWTAVAPRMVILSRRHA